MKVNLSSLTKSKVDSLFIYSTHEAYLAHQLNHFVDLMVKEKQVKTEWVDQNTFLNDPSLLHNQGDLFSPVSADKMIIIQDATDKSAKIIESHIESPNSGIFIVIPAIVGSSIRKLKALHEKEPNAGFATCYLSQGREKQQFLSELCQENNLKLDREAQAFSIQQMEDNLDALLNAFYKLRLYIDQPGQEVTLKELEPCLSDFREASVAPLVTHLGDRSLSKTLRAYHEAKSLGAEEIQLIRGLNYHFSKLMSLRAKVSSGMAPQQAMQAMRPPIFFKQQDEFKRHIARWSEKEITKVMDCLNTIELKIKTGYPYDPTQLWKPVFSLCKVA